MIGPSGFYAALPIKPIFCYCAQLCSEPICPGPLGQAKPNDHTKSRWIQSLDGSGLGAPTGGLVIAANKLMPSVPSLFTEETS